MPYEIKNQSKIDELTSNRGWGDPEEDAEFAGRSVEIDPDEPDVPEQDPDFEEPERTNLEDSEEDVEEIEEDEDPDLVALREESDGRLRALVAERNHRRELNAQLNELSEKFDKLMADKAEEKPSIIPDKEEDPAGYLQSTIAEANQELKTELGELRRSLQERETRDDILEVARASSLYEDNFRQEHEDYDEAFDYLKNDIVEQLITEHDLTPKQAEAQALLLGYQYSRAAMLDGQDPAEFFYNEAQSRGFTPRQTQTRQPQPTPSTRKKRVSLSEPGYSGTGNNPEQRKGVVTRQELFNNFTKAQRMKVWRNPELNRAFATQGEAHIPEGFFD